MEYRLLGRTDLRTSVIGLGTEYLNHRSRTTVVSVVRKAIEAGVNYLDVVFSFKEYRDNLGAALQGRRDKVLLAGHIGCAETRGQYRLSRDGDENDRLFHDLLRRLGTNEVDVLMIQMVNRPESVDAILKPRGLMDLAQRLRREGKARHIGVSGHKVPALVKLLESCPVDVVMFPINIAWDMAPGRKAIYDACRQQGVGLVAMKVFGGGRVFAGSPGRKASKGDRSGITPVQCLSYALAQPGVGSAVPGVRNTAQLESVLKYVTAGKGQRAYKSIIADFREDLRGNCVYCNHCLPCPVGIDIGKTIRALDAAQGRRPASELRARVNFYYPGRIRTSSEEKLRGKALACTECGACVKRCPFDVDVIARMREAAPIPRPAASPERRRP